MNTFKSLLVSTATLLLISGTLANEHHQHRFMHNGKVYDDKFYELFSIKAPVKNIIKLAVSWNAEKQLDHFQQLYHHIKNNDESAKYAQTIVDATRAVLGQTLKEVGFEKEITLEQYLEGTYKIQNDKKFEVEPNVVEAIELLDKIDDDTFEQILNEGAQEEVNWELENLRPYKLVPFDSPESELKPETEEKPVVESQEPTEPIAESQGSNDLTPETQEAIPESQGPKESTPESQVSQESGPETQTIAGAAPEKQETVEEVIAEPPKSDDAVPEIQESKETVPEPQA